MFRYLRTLIIAMFPVIMAGCAGYSQWTTNQLF